MSKLIVCGATGRVGTLICQLAKENSFWRSLFTSSRSEPLEKVINKGDILIDFTLPDGTENHLRLACEHKKPIVIGTTGLNETQMKKIEEASKIIPIVYAANMSIGVNVLFHLIEETTRSLENTFQIEIEETHHVHKLDKPSGTAKEMMASVKHAGGNVEKITSKRDGEVVGDHTIWFRSPTENLGISHHAIERKIFAEGALKAAQWLLQKNPGLYTMRNVLGLT